MEILLYNIDQLYLRRSLAQCLEHLNEQELAEYHQRGERGQHYAYCRSELKLALSRRSGTPARDIHLQQNEHGKPYWAAQAQEQAPAQVHFNISHSRKMLAIALGDSPLGIDVEYMKERSPQQKQAIAKRILQPEQIADLEQQGYADKIFYAYWCGVEALIKQGGLSLWQAKSLPPFLHQNGPTQLEKEQLTLDTQVNPNFPNYMCAVAY